METEKRRKLPTTETFFKTLSAILGTATAVMAFQTARLSNQKNDAEESAANASAQVEELQYTVENQRSELETLEGTSTSVEGTESAGPTRTASGVRIQDSFNGIDFDSAETDWGLSTSRHADGVDLFVGTLASASHGTFGWAVQVDRDPNVDECSNPSNPRWHKYIARTAMIDGSSFCIETSEGGWAWINIDQFIERSDEGYGITVMDITYWSRDALGTT